MISSIIIIIVLTAVNALFSASEMALVSIKPSTLYKLQAEGRRNSEVLEKVTRDSTKYLSTIQVAITFSGFLSSAFAGSKLSTYLVDGFSDIGISIQQKVAVIIVTVILSFFTLVFGELVPKRVALNMSVKIALFSAPILYVVMKLFTPIVWLLTITTRGVTRLIGIKPRKNDDKITEKEIKEMIVYGHIEGLYQEHEKLMLERIFTFDDLKVEKIMTKVDDVTFIDISRSNREIIEKIVESKFSRIPVYMDDKSNIQGVILVKDILDLMSSNDIESFDLKEVIREPYIVPVHTRINVLLSEMRKNKYHMAFINDDLDNMIGIVTFEDIIEEIIGEIYDEHDK